MDSGGGGGVGRRSCARCEGGCAGGGTVVGGLQALGSRPAPAAPAACRRPPLRPVLCAVDHYPAVFCELVLLLCAANASQPASHNGGSVHGRAQPTPRAPRLSRPSTPHRCPPARGISTEVRSLSRRGAALPTARRMASLTSSGIQAAASSWKRMSTFVLTLFTFWPPGPLERAKAKSTSSAFMHAGGAVRSSG